MEFVTEAALIALREGLEALLITGVLLGFVTRLGRADARRHVWLGFWSAVATSVAAGWLVHRYLLAEFEAAGWGAWFEVAAALTAVALLTYMVFWMWRHTRQVMRAARERVAHALTAGSLATIVLITYASVVREGLEVVLFYGALAGTASATDLAWSGAVGFAASGLIVLAVLRGASRVNVQRFFTLTGAWLLIVAAMLLTHAVGALTEVGVLAPAPAIWDTSPWLPDDSATGRVLHALVGYTATPTLLQASLYFGYLFVVGGAYLWRLGAFHAGRGARRRLNPRPVAAAALALAVVTAAVAWGAAHPTSVVGGHGHGVAAAHHDDGHGHPRVGVVLRAHGEPVHYNATTYESFANFTESLLRALGYGELLLVDQGTVLLDASRPFAKGPHLDARLVDAWLQPHDGPAAYVGSPAPRAQEVPLFDGFYVAPAGAGLGEPDILEMAGLSAYQAWLQMENQSPMHWHKEAMLDAAQARLEARYGSDVLVVRAHHVRPHVAPGEGVDHAAQRLADAGVDVVVDAYTSALHSDVMNACMKAPAFRAALARAGYAGPVVEAAPFGLTPGYAEAVADHVAAELAEYPGDARVAVFLTHHGIDPDAQSPCRDRAEPYVAQTHRMFARAADAIAARGLGDRVRVLQVYGQGAGDADDGVLSPREALEAARAWNATHVLDLPFELPGDGYDNLVVQRANYGLAPGDAPHYDADRETHLTRLGMHVRITSSLFGTDARGAALASAVAEAVDRALAAAGHAHHAR